ncbi:lipopolysaccharide cholinephosphotransferase licd [Plakobranchus ocellatus]|uniref:Lipopolysaccharide cholinephosphotransferase licd n=1 Tax=Plakobranchus ocellatus TaxID=259542 RepID=A0AAV4D375_9GAST|nr:lipopolysaccharide cholinephosphotransferase licd [Plakobranchus ocellatus]
MQVPQNHRLRRRLLTISKAMGGILLLLVVCTFISPARNLVFWPFWPNAWRKMTTFDIIQIEISDLPDNVTALAHCPYAKRKPLSQAKLNKALIKDYAQVVKRSTTGELQNQEHLAFMPALPFQEKLGLVWLFAVLARALSDAGVTFFMRGGSLLGAARHRGIIPWDDDIDIAINVSDWKRVREVLSCLDGHYVQVEPNMHWKFSRVDNLFPFIDLFFYAESERYIWALTDYTRRTFTLRKEDVLPLQPTVFEGVEVLVPRRAVKISKELYSYNTCESRSLDHKSGVSFSRVVTVPCSSLAYLYDMYDLDD